MIDPNTIWRHKKGGTYRVLGIGMGCGAPIEGKTLVIYQDDATGRFWIRSEEEFLDGRFTALPAADPAAPGADVADLRYRNAADAYNRAAATLEVAPSATPSLGLPCPHPLRRGHHELYVTPHGSSVCRACGARG